jgi:glycosyltransferase involved in cell wall biosynthesis
VRILLWSDGFWPRIGGVEVIGAHLVRALRDRGHEVTVLTARDHEDVPAEEDMDGIRVLRRRFREPQDAGDVEGILAERRWVTELQRDLRPDVVHVFHVGPNVLFHVQTRSAHPAPAVVTLHLALPPELLEPGTAMGRALREAAWVTTCSAGLRDDLVARLPELAGRSSAVLNRLPPPPVEPAPLPFDPPTLLFLGRLISQKGFDLGLSAFARVADRHPRARIVVAGDGTERAALERQVAELGLAERVEFAGWVAPGATAGLMNRVTAVVMPSRFEPYPLVALEAGQMGRPVLAFDIDGLGEIVIGGVTGTLAPAGDVGALAGAMDALLADPDGARALGRAARAHSLADGSWEAHVDAYEAIYERVT